jgi:hypothetical protein
MKFEQNQHVKCVFKNGTLVEGIVESWTKEEAILTSLDGESMLIIPRPDDDIMLIKLVLSKPIVKEKTKPELPKTELEQKFNEVLAQPSDTPGRVETLAELRIELAEADRKIITDKLKDHHIGTPQQTKYEYMYGGTPPTVQQGKLKGARDPMTGERISAYDLSAIKRNRKGKI